MEHIEKEVGEAAGKIWTALNSNCGMSQSQIAKRTKLSAKLLNQGIGWLAREGKLTTEKSKRTELIKLRE